MRGGGPNDADETDSGSSESGAARDRPGVERKSVLPPSKESFVFPSGRVARPVEDYLVDGGVADPPREPGFDGEDDRGSPMEGEWPVGDAAQSRGESQSSGRLPRWAVWAAIGAVAAILIGAVLMGAFRSNSNPGGSATPTPSMPQVASYFDDGIPDEEYPVVAPSRGIGYPDALSMEEWVWDRVGPGWAIVLVSGESETPPDALPVPVVYLVSPEGRYFDMAELPSRVASGPVLVSWHEQDRAARIVWDHGTKGGLLHLDTGEVEDTSFLLTAGRTKEILFLAANAEGREVWMAWGLDGLETRYFAWTPEAGWERILTGQDDLTIEWFVEPTAPQGAAVALQIYNLADSLLAGKRSLPPGVPNFVVYFLSTGESRRLIPAVPYAEPDCWFMGWVDAENVEFSCWDEAEGVQSDFRIRVDGSGVVETGGAADPWYESLGGRESATHPDGPLELIVEPSTGAVKAVRILGETGLISAIDFETHLGGVARAISSFDEIAPGVFRFVTDDGIVIGVDAGSATIGPTIVAIPVMGEINLKWTHVFFEEASPVGVGLEWGF